MSKILEQKIQSLEQRIIKLEANVRELARTTVVTAEFVNLLIKKAGISEQELQAAILDASIEHVKAKFIRSAKAGAVAGNNGDSNVVVPGTASNGNDSGDSPGPDQKQGGTGQPTQESPNGSGTLGTGPN